MKSQFYVHGSETVTERNASNTVPMYVFFINEYTSNTHKHIHKCTNTCACMPVYIRPQKDTEHSSVKSIFLIFAKQITHICKHAQIYVSIYIVLLLYKIIKTYYSYFIRKCRGENDFLRSQLIHDGVIIKIYNSKVLISVLCVSHLEYGVSQRVFNSFLS